MKLGGEGRLILEEAGEGCVCPEFVGGSETLCGSLFSLPAPGGDVRTVMRGRGITPDFHVGSPWCGVGATIGFISLIVGRGDHPSLP